MRTAVRSMDEPMARGDQLPLPGDGGDDEKPSVAPFHIRWAGIGYGAGLLFVLPLVFWLAEPAPQTAPLQQVVSVAPATRPAPSAAAPKPVRAEVAGPPKYTEPPPPPRIDPVRERLDAAKALIGDRAIEAARMKLQPLSEDGDAEALFLLAGTYDPLQLAALGVTTVRAEAERARHLYERALAAGHEAARARLDQLQ